jgi:membrane-associated protease RseP (regulator of RpoE activity)
MIQKLLAWLVVVLVSLPPSRADESARAYLGIAGSDSADKKGVVVDEVAKDSPAAKAGLRAGDRIVTVENGPVESFKDLADRVSKHKPGDKLMMQIVRDDKEQSITVILGKTTDGEQADGKRRAEELRRQFRFKIPRPGEPFRFEWPRGEFDIPVPWGERVEKRPMIGIQLQPLDDALRERLGVGEKQGVVIADVSPDSPAAKAGLASSDVILEADGKSISEPSVLSDVVRSKKAGGSVKLKIWRDGKTFERDVAVEERSPAADFRFYLGPRGFESGRTQPVPPLVWDAPLRHELEKMQKRLRDLEQELARLRADLDQMRSERKATPPKAGSAEPKPPKSKKPVDKPAEIKKDDGRKPKKSAI